ncbi:MAG: helix-turn-helix transcriptional regulator, partial [Anaerolineales bacterium]
RIEHSMQLNSIEEIISDIKSVEQFEAEMRRMFTIILLYRDKQAKNERKLTLREAKSYLDLNFSDPELKMRDVAQTFNISPGHFSTTFHQEFEITFRDYLCQLRIDHAKGLLRTTSMKCAEIAYQSGFNNSHYFSSVFKKKTGVSPREFRSAVA